MAKKVLVVDDEKLIVKGIRFSLEQDGMEVDCAYDGEEALNMAKANEYDMILLDIMLPKMDGFEVCQAIREFSDMPIVMLTAKGDDMDKSLGLDYGADDYITKPFGTSELLARIRVALRKSNQIPEEKKEKIFQCDYLKVDWEKHQVSIDEKEVHLTPMEYKILKLLIDNRGKVLTHNYILSQIWGSAQGVEAANLRVFMAALRRKIEKDPGNCRFILTEVGVGYRFRETAE